MKDDDRIIAKGQMEVFEELIDFVNSSEELKKQFQSFQKRH